MKHEKQQTAVPLL